MEVCYFGSYARSYAANRIMLKGLRLNNVDVVECHSALSVPKKYIQLTRKHLNLNDYDVLIVGFPGHTSTPIAKILTKHSLVFYALFSRYDTLVTDRKIVKNPFTIKMNYLIDKFACKLSDLVILDTLQHIEYFCKQFGLEKEKFRRSYVGSDDTYFYPRPIEKEPAPFIIFFYGSFIPLQGIEYIVRAAKLLEDQKDVQFELVGSGQTFVDIKKMIRNLKLTNIDLKGWVAYEEIPNHMARADICLGIFGRTAKARRVVPNKVYDALASQKPVVTGDSPAAREVLTHGKDAVLCRMADPNALVQAILTLKENEQLRRKISENGYKLFKRRFSPKVIGRNVKNILKRL